MAQYAERVWGVTRGDRAALALRKTEAFFRSLGMKTRLSEYGIGPEKFTEIAARFDERKLKLGERQRIGGHQGW